MIFYMKLIDSRLIFLKTQIAMARQKLDRIWKVNQMTNMEVLAAGMKLDELCNEYYRLMKELQK